MNFSFIQKGEELFQANGDVVNFSKTDFDTLVTAALHNTNHKARVCTHTSNSDLLHEMFIVHTRETYVRPHRHQKRREGMIIFEGVADMVIFSDNGTIRQVIRLDKSSFYQRLNESFYHMLLIRSDFLAFYEATTGPFNPEETQYASWSPPLSDNIAVSKFIKNVEKEILSIRADIL